MLRAVFRDMSPFSQLMFSIFIIIASFLAFLVVSLVVAIPAFGIDTMLNIATADMNDPQNVTILKYFQVVQSIGVFIVPPFILAWLFQGEISSYLMLNKGMNFATLLLVVLLGFAAMPIINLTGELNSNLHLPEWLSGIEKWMIERENEADSLFEIISAADTFLLMLLNLFIISVLPALGEEMIFRGVFQRIFQKLFRNDHIGIWVIAFIFSAIHLQFFGFVPRFILGLVFGYLYYWSGTLWLPVLAHFVNNAIPTIGVYLQGWESTNAQSDTALWVQLLILPAPIVITVLIMLYF